MGLLVIADFLYIIGYLELIRMVLKQHPMSQFQSPETLVLEPRSQVRSPSQLMVDR